MTATPFRLALVAFLAMGVFSASWFFTFQKSRDREFPIEMRSSTVFEQENPGKPGELVIIGHVEIHNREAKDEVRAVYIGIRDERNSLVAEEWLDPFVIPGGKGAPPPGTQYRFSNTYKLFKGNTGSRSAAASPTPCSPSQTAMSSRGSPAARRRS